jgi:hypothetical protein
MALEMERSWPIATVDPSVSVDAKRAANANAVEGNKLDLIRYPPGAD